MKRPVILLLALVFTLKASAQKIDSVYFNLYTDSLKKGTYNYINVEARYTDGHYLPLGEKDIKFRASAGRFSGNSLYIDTSCRDEKVFVKAVLLSDTSFAKEITIYIKKAENTGRLPSEEEIMGRPGRRRK